MSYQNRECPIKCPINGICKPALLAAASAMSAQSDHFLKLAPQILDRENVNSQR